MPSSKLSLGLLLTGVVSAPLFAAEVAPPETAAPAAVATSTEKLQDNLQPGIASDAVRRFTKAVTIRRQGDTEGAKQILLSLTIDYPSYYNALVLLGNTYNFPRERHLAIDAMERALKVQKEEKIQDCEAAYRLALMSQELKQFEKSKLAYLDALSLEEVNTKEMNARLHDGLAHVYLVLGENEISDRHFVIAAEKYDSQPAQQLLSLRASKAAIDREIARADQAIKPDAKTGYEITTTLPLPPKEAEPAAAPESKPAPAPKPEEGPVGAETVGEGK